MKNKKGKEMKRVCFFIGNMSHSGGTERVTSGLANKLSNCEGYQISILSLVDGLEPFFDLDSKINLFSLYEQKISFKKIFFQTVLKIRKFIKEHNIETLVVVDSISCMFTVPALYNLKVKHICWEHFNFINNNGVRFREIGRKWAAKYCDYVVTLTNRDKSLWNNGLEIINAEIVSIANPTFYENIENEPRLDFKRLLSIGHLREVKGFDLLIQAWSKVCVSNSDWVLRIVGSGEDEKYLKDYAKKLKIYERIEFVSATKKIEQHYEESSFYCLSSRFEGLPMVLLEAQAFGLPIIAFNCDTGPSDVIEDKKNGWLVENGNVDKLAKNIEMAMGVYQNEYADLSRSAKQSSLRFSINTISKEWLKIL